MSKTIGQLEVENIELRAKLFNSEVANVQLHKTIYNLKKLIISKNAVIKHRNDFLALVSAALEELATKPVDPERFVKIFTELTELRKETPDE
jgi:hypothetical protein